MFSVEADLNAESPKQASRNLGIWQHDLVWLAGLQEQELFVPGRSRGRVKPHHMTLEFLQMLRQEGWIEQE